MLVNRLSPTDHDWEQAIGARLLRLRDVKICTRRFERRVREQIQRLATANAAPSESAN
jgi:hypothetical protein